MMLKLNEIQDLSSFIFPSALAIPGFCDQMITRLLFSFCFHLPILNIYVRPEEGIGMRMDEMMIRRGGIQEQFAYSAGRFVGDEDAFVINQPAGVSPFGGIMCSPGADYAVELFPDGSGMSWFSGTDITMPNGMGKAWYIKDLDNDDMWSPFYGPTCCKADEYEVTYLPGQVTIYSLKNKIACYLTISTVSGSTCEIWHVRLQNRSARERAISFTTYIEPCVAKGLEVKYLGREKALVMRRPLGAVGTDYLSNMPQDMVIFHSSTLTPVRFQTERSKFIGEGRKLKNPEHVENDRSAGIEGNVEDCIASMTVEIDLPIEGDAEFGFCFGLASNTDKALEIIRAFKKTSAIAEGIDHNHNIWKDLCSSLRVETSDRVFDALINTWLPYEAYTGWIHERSETAFLEPSHVADLLRRVNAFCTTAPDMFRDCLVNFAAGLSVIGAYSPNDGTLVSLPPRELLWLAISTAKYVGETGDLAVLSESIALQNGLSLTLREHCERAIKMCINDRSFAQDPMNNALLEQAIVLWSFLDEEAKGFNSYLDTVRSRKITDAPPQTEQRELPRRVRYLQSISPALSDKHIMESLSLWMGADEFSPADVGTACGLYSTLVEQVLGLLGTYEGLTVNLQIPESWYECDIIRRFRNDIYNIHVMRSASHNRKGTSVVVDGEPVLGTTLPYFGDGKEHKVDIIIS